MLHAFPQNEQNLPSITAFLGSTTFSSTTAEATDAVAAIAKQVNSFDIFIFY